MGKFNPNTSKIAITVPSFTLVSGSEGPFGGYNEPYILSTAIDASGAASPSIDFNFMPFPKVAVGERVEMLGRIYKVRELARMAEKLARVLTDDALRAKLSGGCRAAVARFSRDRHLERILGVYDEVLARGARRPAGAPPALDPELMLTVDRTVRQLAEVEEWALGMKGHIDWLEETGQAGGARNRNRYVGDAGGQFVGPHDRRLPGDDRLTACLVSAGEQWNPVVRHVVEDPRCRARRFGFPWPHEVGGPFGRRNPVEFGGE